MAAPDPADWWAFQPLRVPPGSYSVDVFIDEKLAAAKLRKAPPASRESWLRRVTFDLTGLPPTPEETAEFLADKSSGAFERVVERLLESPRYGERWARWWLDVARYADSNGQDENKVLANAWRYRDWVVRTFNANLPFDQFITEQLAGDLLPAEAEERRNFDRLIATGFLVLGPKMLAEQDKPKLVMDIVDEQIDTVGRAFLGLTLGCARCHDHKFDPVSARDYYAMAGIFKSTRTMEDLAFVSKFNERSITPKAELEAIAAHAKRWNFVTNQIAGAKGEAKTALERERDELSKAAPPPAAHALAVAEEKPVDLPVHLRGSHLMLASNAVPRGFIEVVARRAKPPAIPAERSGRLELARWLTAPEHPLTARVIVNRLWQAHFGEGLVRSPENFGLRGEHPTHPELLDWLADEFLRSGWDVKAIHRLMVNSAVYRRSSIARQTARAATVDPENRLLARFPRLRLEAEMVRDAVLGVSGRLDVAMGGSLVDWKNNEYVPGDNVSAKSVRRTIYLPIVRDRVFDALTIFDFANPGVCTARRAPTIVAHQALFFMNSPLVKDSSTALAATLLARADLDEAGRVREAYARILNRPVTRAELRQALRFLEAIRNGSGSAEAEADRKREDLAAFCQTLMAANEFVYRP